MGISKANVEDHCYFNTMKKGKSMFSRLNQKSAEAVRTLQEWCAFLSYKDFINALEYNAIEGVNF